MSASAKGKVYSSETIEKFRLAKIGKKQSKEHKQKGALARTGLKRSDETKAKFSALKSKAVIVNGVEYVSQDAAAEAIGMSLSTFYRKMKDPSLTNFSFKKEESILQDSL